MDRDRNRLKVFDVSTSLDLLGRASLGRSAVTIGALPSGRPVEFRVTQGEIVFRTPRSRPARRGDALGA